MKVFDWILDKWLAGFITASIFFLLKLYIDLPLDVKPVCNQCGTIMEMNSLYPHNSAECHRCRLEGRQHYFQLFENFEYVTREIVRRIHNNEMRK